MRKPHSVSQLHREETGEGEARALRTAEWLDAGSAAADTVKGLFSRHR